MEFRETIMRRYATILEPGLLFHTTTLPPKLGG